MEEGNRKELRTIVVPNSISEFIKDMVNNNPDLVENPNQANFEISSPKKNLKPVRIGNKLVGHEHPAFIVAEIGINHNGDLEICKKLIDIAVDAGCDAVKFQKRTPDLCVPEEQKNIPRETPWGMMTYLEYKKRIEFGESEYREIDNYCKQKGIMWFASSWDLESVDFLEKFHVPCYKIPSASLTDKELLMKVKGTGKPIILSTGMSTIQEIEEAVNLIGEDNLILLHCNSAYPTPRKEENLRVIQSYMKKFNCPIGYSGHETGITWTLAASVLGACFIERHITLDRAMYGSDQAASLEKEGINRVCSFIKLLPEVLGDGVKKVYASEIGKRKSLRKV